MKKIIGFIVLIALLASTAAPVCADTAAPAAGEYEYSLNTDGTAVITGFGGFAQGQKAELVIPEKLDGHPVTAIGSYVFFNNTGLTGVTLPEGVIEIGLDVFSFCPDLARVDIPASVRKIEYSAFTGSGIKAFSVAEGNPYYQSRNGVLFDREGPMLHTYPMKSRLRKYKVPDGTRKLGDTSFRGSSLETVTLPKSLEEIGTWAFSYCNNLTALDLPKKVRVIGYGAFEGSSVGAITVAEGNAVYEVRDGALFDRTRDMLHSVLVMPDLKRYEVPEGTKEIASCAFGQVKSLEEIVIPDTVDTIGPYAFRYTALKSVLIPDSVTDLGQNTFYFCPTLKKAVLSAGLEEIPYGMFSMCSSLESVTIKAGTKRIGGSVFSYCEALTRVSIPKCVEKIDSCAFFACENLVSLNIPASVTEIGDSAFAQCGKLTLNVVKGSYAQKYAESNGIPFKVKAD